MRRQKPAEPAKFASPCRLLPFALSIPLLCLLLSACHAETPWRGIIKVAIVAPYSGPLATEGQSMLAGARLAEGEINTAGGVDGYRILLVAPDEGLPSTPASIVEDPAIEAVVGHLLSDGQKAGETYRKAGLVWLATEPVEPADGVYPMVGTPDAHFPTPTGSATWSSFVARLGGSVRIPADAALGYDGVHLAAAAFGRAIETGEVDRSSVDRELSSTRYAGVLGRYGPNGRQNPVAAARHDTVRFSGQTLLGVED